MNPEMDRFLLHVAEDRALGREIGRGRLTPSRIVALAAEWGSRVTQEDLARESLPLGARAWAVAKQRYAGPVDAGGDEPFILFLEEAPMSKKAMAAFFKKAAEDETLRRKLAAFAAEQGFEFDADELSEVDLERLAGGAGFIKVQGSSTGGIGG